VTSAPEQPASGEAATAVGDEPLQPPSPVRAGGSAVASPEIITHPPPPPRAALVTKGAGPPRHSRLLGSGASSPSRPVKGSEGVN